MSVQLQAPLPAPQTTLLLPNPQVSDVESPKHEIDIFRALDGTKRTSVKSTTRRLLTYTFIVDRIKAEGIKAFFQSYHSSMIRLRDHKNQTWEVHLVSNPIEFGQDARHRISCQIQFEGSKVS